jgi:hypothetical protein
MNAETIDFANFVYPKLRRTVYELLLMMEKVDTANGPLAQLFSTLSID